MLLTVPPLFDWRRADLRWRAGCSSVYEQCTAGGCGRAWQVRELGARRQQQHLDAAGWPALSPWGGDRAADWSWRAAVSGRRRRRIQSGDQGTTNTTTTTTNTTTTNTNTTTCWFTIGPAVALHTSLLKTRVGKIHRAVKAFQAAGWSVDLLLAVGLAVALHRTVRVLHEVRACARAPPEPPSQHTTLLKHPC